MTMNPGAKKLKNILIEYFINDIVLMSDTWYPVRKVAPFVLSREQLEQYIANDKWRVRNNILYMYEKHWDEVMSNVNSKA